MTLSLAKLATQGYPPNMIILYIIVLYIAKGSRVYWYNPL